MGEYKFTSNWTLDHPIEPVWDLIHSIEDWPAWWPGVNSVVEIEKGNSNGVGAQHRSTWKSRLPYRLEFESEVVRIEHHKSIEVRALGELEGRGLWAFELDGRVTHVRYDWEVHTRKAWMNLLAPLARPLFRWNHDVLMAWGEAGLKRRLADRA